jgi:hypothetical protein
VREEMEFRVENKPVLRPRMNSTYDKYPFAKMKVGQSFFIERGLVDTQAVRTAAAHYGKRHNVKFSIVRDGDGYRCGRIA